jgi:hypothetical protein
MRTSVVLQRAFRAMVCAALAAAASPRAAFAETTRFALVVGHNTGRGALPPLRYAESDAGKVSRLLLELGDVAPENLVLLQGRRAAELETALAQLQRQVSRAKSSPEARTVLLFYFSGHSDGEAIELGEEAFPYSRLKALLGGTGAEVRLAIIDACRSGASFRQKGGRPAEPFVIKLSDQLNTAGEAFITSSAADEASLESGAVMGSIFTHHLVSGLRGAADVSGDKLVTLGEAYRYAFEQTVAGTAMMPVGPQHPSYDYRLSGQGELVLTSLLTPSVLLTLPEDIERGVVSDVLRDQVLVELPGGARREVALPPGQYGVRLFRGGQSFGARVTLVDGARRLLRWEEVVPITSAVPAQAKGSGLSRAVATPGSAPLDRRVVSLAGGVVSTFSDLGLMPLARVAFEPRAGFGLSFALSGGRVGVATVSESGFEVRAGLRGWIAVGPLWCFAGGEVGPGFWWQNDARSTAFTVALAVAPRVGARLALGGPLALSLELEGALALLRLDGRFSAVFRPQGTLGLAYTF